MRLSVQCETPVCSSGHLHTAYFVHLIITGYGPWPYSEHQQITLLKKSITMSIQVLSPDILPSSIPKLNPHGKNWAIFQIHFQNAMEVKVSQFTLLFLFFLLMTIQLPTHSIPLCWLSHSHIINSMLHLLLHISCSTSNSAPHLYFHQLLCVLVTVLCMDPSWLWLTSPQVMYYITCPI